MSYRLIGLLLGVFLAGPVLAQQGPNPPGQNRPEDNQSEQEKSAQKPPDQSQPSPTVQVELNKLEAMDSSCRAFLIVKNGTRAAFESLRLDLVMFDADGIVAKRLAVEAAPLPADKTSLKVFDIDALECGDIGQILLNDVLACQGESGDREDCLGLLSVTSRSDTPLFK